MNTLLAPVRWIKSLAQTVLLLAIAAGIGLAYPIIQLCNGEPLTLASILVPVLTVLALFAVFYAPVYTIGGGIVVIIVAAAESDFVINNLSAEGIVFLIFAFFVVGILQRYARHRLFDPPKEPKAKQLSFVEQLNQVPLERKTREYDAMSPELRVTMTRLYGDNYVNWPEPTDDSAPEPDTAAGDDNEPSKHFATLGIRNGAKPEEVKQAYRDLAKVWHPDRFDDGDTRLKQKAEEQLKKINDAYMHLQEQRPASSIDESEEGKPEHRHEIRSDQDLIDAIDATRKRVDATTKEMQEFLEQMKERKRTALESSQNTMV